MSERTNDAEFLHAFLAERDMPCPNCGYNLRSLTSARCPECAEELVLQIGLQEPKLVAYLGGIVGLAAGAGFDGLLVLYAVLVMSFNRGGPGPVRFLIITATGFLIHAAALMTWMRMRRRIRRFSPKTRRILVIFCWALPLANLAVFIKFIP